MYLKDLLIELHKGSIISRPYYGNLKLLNNKLVWERDRFESLCFNNVIEFLWSKEHLEANDWYIVYTTVKRSDIMKYFLEGKYIEYIGSNIDKGSLDTFNKNLNNVLKDDSSAWKIIT